MKLRLENLPPELQSQRETLAQCLEAFNRVRHVHAVYLFGSNARRDAHPDSDVDLCIVADGAEQQLETAKEFRRAIRDVRPKPAFTLLPITPERLQEKKACADHFFQTVLQEGVLLASEN
jgi:predicted nucleotidyltransferase